MSTFFLTKRGNKNLINRNFKIVFAENETLGSEKDFQIQIMIVKFMIYIILIKT